MKNLGIGLVIGASLASSVGGTFKSLDKSIGQLQAKAKDVKLGISAGEKWKDLRSESLKLSSALQAGKLDAAGTARFHQLKAATKEAEAEARRYGFTLGGLNKQLGTMYREYRTMRHIAFDNVNERAGGLSPPALSFRYLDVL